MKKLLLLSLTLASALSVFAVPNFSAAKKYQIVCTQFSNGCVTDGATAGQNTPLYHRSEATKDEVNYWQFNEEAEGLFSIKNLKTGQYVTYDGERQDTPMLRRYITMTDALDGRNSLWTIAQQAESVYTIRNAQQTDHIWDVRVDTYCVGTYSNNGRGNTNQLFIFYDEDGNMVKEKKESTSNGYDVSSWLEATTDMLDGWTNEGGWFMNTGAGGSHYNGDASTVAPFIENWHATDYGPLNNCSLTQKLKNMPAGKYLLQADMIGVWQGSNGWYNQSPEAPGTGIRLFIDMASTEVGTANNLPQRYQVNVVTTSMKDITLGVNVAQTNANWIAIDNIVLYYQGTEKQLIDGEKAKVKAELISYFTESETDQMIASCGDDFEALEALRRSVANMPTIDPLATALYDLTIDKRSLAYAESTDIYLATTAEDNFGKSITATIDYKSREGWGTLSINGTTVEPGGTYTFANVKGGQTYTASVKQTEGNGTITKKITFTALPVVKLYGSFDNNYSDGYIQVIEPAMDSIADMLFMKAKWRGGITNNADKHKRNYHVKLKDEFGDKLEKKFFDLRNDNSWILEACQVDMSRIRNRVLTDLWNDYSTPPYYIEQEKKAKTGTRGQFVELILNDEYRGIYCMTENMDRKQMKLMKYDEETGVTHGQMWKSKDWTYATLMGTRPDGGYYPKDFLSDPSPSSEMWDKYEVKYPDFEDMGNQTNWDVLYNAVDFVCHSTDTYFKKHFAEYFDLPVVIDYYILQECNLATDNHGKNMFFGVYDQQQDKKITFAVWDMDATCGQRWSDEYFHSTLMQPEQDYSEYIAINEHGDYNLFKRLRDNDVDDFNMKVRLRYRDLRETYLDTESVLNRFRTYLNTFKLCGAAKREYDKWNGDTDIARRNLDFDNEMEYLTDWITRRLNYLDTKRFDIASLPSDIAEINSAAASEDNGVYDLQGRKVSQNSTVHTSQLKKGIYIVNGKKVLVK
jgi:hypothetical protein